MTTISTDWTVGLLSPTAAYPNHQLFYTCEKKSYGKWICEKGRKEGIWVGICKFQPEAWHKSALAKNLGVKGDDVAIQESKPSEVPAQH